MHITSYLIRRSPQFPTFMRHLRHSRDVSDVRPTFATFGFQRITSHLVQTCPESFLSCLFASLVRRFSISFHISYCICTDGLASWPITSQSPLIPNSSHHLLHGFGLCSLALLSITFRFLDVPIALATFSAVLAILYRSFHT